MAILRIPRIAAGFADGSGTAAGFPVAGPGSKPRTGALDPSTIHDSTANPKLLLEPMRLFVGIWPSSGLEPRLRDFQAALRPSTLGPGPRLRFTPPHQWHLTLRFLGEVAEDRVEDLSRKLLRTVSPIRAFRLRLAAPGCFPERGAPRVVWVGLDGDLPQLSALHAAVSTTTAAFAASPESQPFHPHLTLARIAEARPRDRDRLLAALQRAPAPLDPNWDVTHVRLVRSELRPEGARYSVVTEIPLVARNESAD